MRRSLAVLWASGISPFNAAAKIRHGRVARQFGGLRSACVSLTTRAAISLNYVLRRRGQQTPGDPKAGTPSKFCSTLEVFGSRGLSIWTKPEPHFSQMSL
jgi:hypothetical protein